MKYSDIVRIDLVGLCDQEGCDYNVSRISKILQSSHGDGQYPSDHPYGEREDLYLLSGPIHGRI